MNEGDAERALRLLYGDIGDFSRGLLPRHALRGYQLEPARAIVDSVLHGRGRQFALVFARQAGKDETLAQLLAYLLNLHQRAGGAIVVAAPTFRPQSLIGRARLLARLDNPLNRGHVEERAGYIVGLGRASARFLSPGPIANARGETASLLLIANEAQDISPERWDAVFDPMAASTNATTVFSGTVWSNRTLLARQIRHLRDLERADGVRRVFLAPWPRVAADVPAYGERVRARIAQFGRDHPFIRTEYDLEELDGAGGLFGPARRAQLQGDHPRQRRAPAPSAPAPSDVLGVLGTPGRLYALLVDVAGEDDELAGVDDGAGARRGPSGRGTRRDSTALTVVEIERATSGTRPSPLIAQHSSLGTRQLPSYRVVDRRLWTGARHTDLCAALVDLARNVWRARRVVVDATGIGAGLASFLAAALGRAVVTPFVFSAASKSDLGWRLLAAIDSGRLKDYVPDGEEDTRLFWRQLEACEYEVRPGPGKLLSWGVPDPRLHDDLLLRRKLGYPRPVAAGRARAYVCVILPVDDRARTRANRPVRRRP
ncbi:MAG TPA: hypothetical protein VFL91_05835 [Thermomicrobiales bacterium]|nr:hypothetical protein [Thermomicrobiales bacterium]